LQVSLSPWNSNYHISFDPDQWPPRLKRNSCDSYATRVHVLPLYRRYSQFI